MRSEYPPSRFDKLSVRLSGARPNKQNIPAHPPLARGEGAKGEGWCATGYEAP